MGRRQRARKPAPKPLWALCRASHPARRRTTALLPGSDPSRGPAQVELAQITNTACPRVRTRPSGGGASKSQPRRTVAGRPIYLGGRKPAVLTCRDEVVADVEALVADGEEQGFTVEVVHAAMDSCGSRWPRETVAKTMLRMTRPARRPPYVQLERAEPDLYRVVPSREELGRS